MSEARALVRHLECHGCELLREGENLIFANRHTRKSSAVPRHSDINEFLARKICRDLGVPEH